MIVLDANVLIAYLDGDNVHHDRATELLRREVDDDFGLNSLTLAEVLVAPTRSGQMVTATAFIRDLEIQELPLLAGSAGRLAELRADTGLKMPGCCVLLSAEMSSSRVASFDERLTREAAARGLQIVSG